MRTTIAVLILVFAALGCNKEDSDPSGTQAERTRSAQDRQEARRLKALSSGQDTAQGENDRASGANPQGPEEPQHEVIEVRELSTRYSLCDADQAQFSLKVNFSIKGVTEEKEIYHFPCRFSPTDHYFIPSIPMCSMDGPGGFANLSYGLWDVNSTGITFRVSCSYSIDRKEGNVERNITVPWLEPMSEDTDEITISLQWIERKPNRAMDRD